MPRKPATLKEDYLRLLQDPTPLEKIGLVHDSNAILPTRPLAGEDIERAWAYLKMEAMLVTAMDKDEPSGLSPSLLKSVIEDAGSEQSSLDAFEKELLVAIERLELNFPLPYLVADFPLAYPFNAASVLRPAGVLVLMNRGLTDMLWFAASLFSIGLKIQITSQRKEVRTVDQLPFPKEQISEWLARVILAYLRDKNAHSAGHLFPTFGRARLMLVACLVNECTKFVLAHEFAHIIADHLTEDVSVAAETGRDDLIYKVLEHVFKSLEQGGGVLRLTTLGSEQVSRRWQQEVEADQLGLRILFAGLASRQGDRELVVDYDNPLFEFTAAAPFFLFAIYQLITEVEKARTGHRGTISLTEHPPAELREQFVKMTYEAWGLPKLPHLANELTKWFAGIQGSVIEMALKLTS